MTVTEPPAEPGRAWQVPPWWTDPTKNVESLVEANSARQDDLREMQARYTAQIGEMREVHATYIAELRSGFEALLRQAESGRIDAIRAVDVGAVNRAAEVAATQATALATQLVATAEASRVQVAAAAAASVTSLEAALEPLRKDVRELRDAQSTYRGGKEQVVESRDIRGEQRLNVNTLILALSLLLTAGILYAAFHH